MKYMFVCTGNTCRSPMAEALFNKICEDNNIEHFSISRGLSVFFPQPVNPKSLESLKKQGVSDFKHTALGITEDDVAKCDVILTMTSSHKLALKNSFSKYKSKIFTINEKAYGKESDIDDPFGKSQEVYDKCLLEIKEAILKILCIK